MANITIQPIQLQHVAAVKNIILQACVELQVLPCKTVQEVDAICRAMGELDDLDHVEEVYTKNRGAFLVALDNDAVAGSGAIKKLTDITCELKRMFFAPEYRGKGLGLQMISELISQAKQLGYKHIQLNVYNPSNQQAAVALYKKFGFYEILPYKASIALLYMQKDIA